MRRAVSLTGILALEANIEEGVSIQDACLVHRGRIEILSAGNVVLAETAVDILDDGQTLRFPCDGLEIWNISLPLIAEGEVHRLNVTIGGRYCGDVKIPGTGYAYVGSRINIALKTREGRYRICEYTRHYKTGNWITDA